MEELKEVTSQCRGRRLRGQRGTFRVKGKNAENLEGGGKAESFNIYYISTVNRQYMQRPDVLLQLGYTWRHVSAFKRPSSGQIRIIFLRYSQNFDWPHYGPRVDSPANRNEYQEYFLLGG